MQPTVTPTPDLLSSSYDAHAFKAESSELLKKKLASKRKIVMFLQSVLLWNKPIPFIALFVGILSATWIISRVTSDSSVLTLFCLGNIGFVATMWLINQIPANLIPDVESETATSTPNQQIVLGPLKYSKIGLYSFDEVCNKLVEWKSRATSAWKEVVQLREVNITKFTLQSLFVLLVGAYLGSVVSGFVFSFFGIAVLLLVPGFVAHGLAEVIYGKLQPYINQIKTKIDATLGKYWKKGTPEIETALPKSKQD